MLQMREWNMVLECPYQTFFGYKYRHFYKLI